MKKFIRNSPEKNIWLAYYEKRHLRQIKKDKRRKQEIIGCEFIEIKEWEI